MEYDPLLFVQYKLSNIYIFFRDLTRERCIFLIKLKILYSSMRASVVLVLATILLWFGTVIIN